MPGRPRAAVAALAGGVGGGAGAVVVMLMGLVVLSRDRAAASRSASIESDEVIDVTSEPTGAQLRRRDGEAVGVTPLRLSRRQLDADLELVKPGYLPATVRAAVGHHRFHARLERVEMVAGRWAGADGRPRLLRRIGEHIEVDGEDEASSPRRFELVPARGNEVAFVATVVEQGGQGSVDPSCRFELTVEYRYRPDQDELWRRREVADYEVEAGRCRVRATGFAEAERLVRLPDAARPADEASR